MKKEKNVSKMEGATQKAASRRREHNDKVNK